MPQPRSPLDAALDLFVYMPVGLAVTAAEEIPKLAAKGRSRVDTQLKMARVVGEFAVSSARQQLERRLTAPPSPRPAASSPPAPAPADATPSAPSPGPAGQSVSPNGSPAPARPAPSASSLAIPGYDSLSASQVVQRLAGLSAEELAAVAAYERAHRARRTILTRAAQLQGTA
ncbi:MAG TPA: hypothetical protein VKV23_06765 [Acidimicrobiales bacterium]|nr:hypothetical protein [Acidimicrobiales bacterium]